jgi:hypothetical protein
LLTCALPRAQQPVTKAGHADLLNVAHLLGVPADEAIVILESSCHTPPPTPAPARLQSFRVATGQRGAADDTPRRSAHRLGNRRYPFRLLDLLPDRRLDHAEIPGNLPDEPVAALVQRNHLGLELGCERTAAPRRLAMLPMGASFRGEPLMLGCPSKRATPKRPR